jgi:Pyruvate/2-oxoglutarate dehydrogenase complex, dihydrolipoamide dehydrogenase (E3) component, and related enzymes
MSDSYDLIVIGTGSAALTIAFQCRSAGWSVAAVDSRPFGGTCALRGCDPKKILVGAADAIDWVRRMSGKGLDSTGSRILWPELMNFKRSFTGPVPGARQQALEKAGIAAYHGRAHFDGLNRITIDGEVLEARHFAIASGSHPTALGIPGQELAITSDQFMELDALPDQIAFIGGGYIAFEFGHLSARAGAQVTILHRGAQALKGFDPDLAGQLVKKSRSLGIEVELETQVTAIEKASDGLVVHARTPVGERVFHVQAAVHAAGRVPEIEDMNLEAAQIAWTNRGVTVNEHLQSVSNSSVYAAGDASASGNPALTPVAGYEGRVAAANLLKPQSMKLEPRVTPSVVFSIPPLATVGLSEEQARAKGLKFRTVARDTSSWYSSRRVGEDCSGSKILIEEDSGRILGAHLLGPHAEEVINVFAVAIDSRLPGDRLKEILFAYPTNGSDIQYMI